jgi:hypothetical protein
MPLTKLQFRPGVNRETTSYTNEGGWFDCDKIRFRFGTPEKIGGWQKKGIKSYLGSARTLHPFIALDGSRYIGVGTHLKYYIEEGGGYTDITPLRLTTAAGDVTFAAANGSPILTVSETAHGALVNDFVTFDGAASLGGNITAAILNQEYQIISVINSNSYTISARTVSTIDSVTVDGAIVATAVNASGSDSGNGGSSGRAKYQVNTGLDTTVIGTGWGAGTWSRGTWNSGSSTLVAGAELRTWSHDNFGEDLLINARDAGIFYWDKSAGPTERAVGLSTLTTDTTTPTIAKQVLVSDRDKHVVVFGCDAQDAVGTQDPLLVRFSAQGDPFTWESQVTNTAGDLRIGSGSEIVSAVETRQQILILTDTSLHAMQFVGPPFTFGISQLADNITIMSPLSAVAVDDNVFWMGLEEFYAFTGQVQKLPCSVKSFVFNDINLSQRSKIVAGVNSSFSEIWWFYPSASSSDNDRYVVYNYAEQVWYYGALARNAWLDRGVNDDPISAGEDGYLYLQEIGYDDGSTSPASAITAYIESSQVSIGEGDRFVFMRKVLPDLTFDGSTSDSPSANFIFQARNFPGGNYLQSNTSAVTRTATAPVEQFTDQVNLRLRGRSFALKVQSTTTGTSWRLGTPRVDIRQDGRQ